VFRGTLGDLMRESRRSKIRDIALGHDQPLPRRAAGVIGERAGTIVRRTRTMDGEAFAYTVNYLPAKFGRMLTKRALATDSLMSTLEDKGVVFATADQVVRAQLADLTVADSLGIPLGSAVLYVERVLRMADAAVIERVESWYRGDLYEYTVTFSRDADSLHRNLA
jgi:GntR family transcriptional regulator